MGSYGGADAEMAGAGQQDILTKEEIESLKEYCEIFDKIMVSKNPAVREAWKNISLLIGLTQPASEKEDPRVLPSRHGGPFSRLAQTVERSLMIQKEVTKHVTGLQYQIDQLKEAMKKNGANRRPTADWGGAQEDSSPSEGSGY